MTTANRPRFLKGYLRKIALYGLLIAILLFFIVPILIMWFTALRPHNSVIDNPLSIPEKFSIENIVYAWNIGKMGVYFINSIIANIPRAVGVVFISCLAGYGFAKMRFPYRDHLFYLILFGMMIPFQAIMIPLYISIQKMHMINTYWALIIPVFGLSMPFATFFMRAFFRDLPNELMESARIDGAGEIRTFWNIMLPLTKPALSTLFVFEFMWGWNDFMLPLITIYKDKLRTLPIGLMYFKTAYTTDYSLVAAGVTISSLPIILVYILFQKNFIQGITAGSVKG